MTPNPSSLKKAKGNYKCKHCEPKANKFIGVVDVRNPVCPKCGRELIKKIKKIDTLEYLEADSITDPVTARLWIANSFIRVADKINEIIRRLNGYQE